MSPAQLRAAIADNDLWIARWTFEADMNGDGVVSISDVWLWLKWIYFAPGDFVLLVTMQKLPAVAQFFEINPFSLFGWLSGVISAGFFVIVLSMLSAFDGGKGITRSRLN